MNDKSHLTAITRRALSVPMRYLDNAGLLSGEVLDYGCGKGFDADELGLRKYDPHFFPGSFIGWADFDTITCNYVLNVMPADYAGDVLEEIRSLLKPDGVAYITVRRDVAVDGHTAKGTYQRNVVLDLPVVHEKKGAYCIYELRR